MTDKKPDKHYYDVKEECLVPATFVYHILAESPEQAAEIAKKTKPNGIKYRLEKKKKIKLIVYTSNSIVVRFSQTFNEK